MPAPAFPDNEGSRLFKLRSLELLDTVPEERFDRITRLAQRTFGVPTAIISLVDQDRLWCKSTVGLDVREMPRSISLCAHAILSDDILIVPDATADSRFADNPLVTGAPHVRFYAGCPLDIGGGNRVGSLCLIDTQPRTFSEEQKESLRDLARIVVQELKAASLATTDALTTLSNRRGFFNVGQQVVDLCKRTNSPVTLLLFDLDQFKSINNGFGHAEGDYALRSFAELLRPVFRSSDVIGRLGGDKFVVLLPCASHAQAVTAIERFRLKLARFNANAARGYTLSCSISACGHDALLAVDLSRMLAQADKDMYLSKRRRLAEMTDPNRLSRRVAINANS